MSGVRPQMTPDLPYRNPSAFISMRPFTVR
jgi:hypothetical protein